MRYLQGIMKLLFLLTFGLHTNGFAAASATAVALKDYSSVASGLFNNMRTPAALIGGAIVPLGLLGSSPVDKADTPRMKMLKRANILVAIASILSEVVAITHSTIAINKLAEVRYPLTASAAELISNHFELAWIGTNIHFLFGMFGFGLLVGNRAFVNFGAKVGKIAACWGVSAFLQCISIVNRGIALGSGDYGGIGDSTRFASNMFTLSMRYIKLVLRDARGALSIASLGVLILSAALTANFLADPDDDA